jgi:hypothetical protein
MRVTDAEHFDERGREARRVEGLEKEDSRTENDSNLRVYTCIPHVILFAERVSCCFYQGCLRVFLRRGMFSCDVYSIVDAGVCSAPA